MPVHGTQRLADEARLDDPAFYVQDPHPTYARLRSEAPVFWYAPGGFWALSRYDDIARVSKDPVGFSTSRVSFVKDIAHVAKSAQRSQAGLTFAADPPDHARYRGLVSRAFTPRTVRDLEPLIRDIVRATLDGLPSGAPVDVVETVSVPVSINVIAAMLGVPRADWDHFRRATDAFVEAADAVPGTEAAARMQASVAEFLEYLDHQVAQRRAEPRDDLMTAIAMAELDGERLAPALQVQFCFNLLAAGNETTRNTLSAATVALAEHPDQWRMIVADRGVATSATEEVLRWTSVLHSFVRTATQDTVIGDQEIAAGDFVAMLYPSGNRDETQWERADEFDVTREPRPTHLTFGVGPHFCVGAGLARLEIRVVLEELSARFAELEPAGDGVRLPSTVVDRYATVPVMLRRA